MPCVKGPVDATGIFLVPFAVSLPYVRPSYIVQYSPGVCDTRRGGRLVVLNL